jgi:plastocyanin
MKTTLPVAGLPVLALAGLAAAACFSERSTGASPNVAAECRVPVTVIDSLHVLVAIRAFAFYPDTIAVRVGATVTWVNCEPPVTEPHTTTSDAPGWDSGDLNPGDRYSHRFGAAGTFPYHCTPHEPIMKGEVIVQ